MGKKYEFQVLDDLGFEFGIQIEQDEEKDKDGNVTGLFYKFDCMNNRPDLLTEATLVRAFKIYLEEATTPLLTLSPVTTSMVVEPAVK